MSNQMEPKPCPFCGNYPVFKSARFDLYGLTGTLGCENPACMVRPRTVIEAEKLAAIVMWNSRANGQEDMRNVR